MNGKKGFAIGDMLPIGITLVVLGIALSYGLQVIGDVQDDMTEDSYEWNATDDTLSGVSKLPNKLGTIVGIIVAAIIIGILIRYLLVK